MKLFRLKKKKKTSKSVAPDDKSEYTEQIAPEPVRYNTTPIRQLRTSRRDRMDSTPRSNGSTVLSGSTKREVQRLTKGPQPKSIMTELQFGAGGNWLTRTRFFQDMCDSVFSLMDTDGSGEIDEKELYSGLLLVHLKLGTYAGPAACRPISRERCHLIFDQFDKDRGGTLDRHEFGNVMGVLFGNVLTRVVLQYTLTLMIVPFLANSIVDGAVHLAGLFWHFLTTLDEHSSLANQIELSVELVRDLVCDFYRSVTPSILQTVGDGFAGVLAKVPESVWLSLPLTLTSAILGLLIVPRTIMNMDDFFQWWAEQKSKKLDASAAKKTSTIRGF